MLYLGFCSGKSFPEQSHTSFGVGSKERSFPSPPPPRVEFITFTTLLNVSSWGYTAHSSVSCTIINIELGISGLQDMHSYSVYFSWWPGIREKVEFEHMASLH